MWGAGGWSQRHVSGKSGGTRSAATETGAPSGVTVVGPLRYRERAVRHGAGTIQDSARMCLSLHTRAYSM